MAQPDILTAPWRRTEARRTARHCDFEFGRITNGDHASEPEELERDYQVRSVTEVGVPDRRGRCDCETTTALPRHKRSCGTDVHVYRGRSSSDLIFTPNVRTPWSYHTVRGNIANISRRLVHVSRALVWSFTTEPHLLDFIVTRVMLRTFSCKKPPLSLFSVTCRTASVPQPHLAVSVYETEVLPSPRPQGPQLVVCQRQRLTKTAGACMCCMRLRGTVT